MVTQKPINKKSLIAKYNRLEDNNEHNDCAILLAKTFGTKEEVKLLETIKTNHLSRGHILYEEIQKRLKISNKYYKRLMSL
jgi:hypothetical protein